MALDFLQFIRASETDRGRMGITTKAGRRIFREGRSAFDPNYNSATPELAAVGVED